jgi:hypothetical protein
MLQQYRQTVQHSVDTSGTGTQSSTLAPKHEQSSTFAPKQSSALAPKHKQSSTFASKHEHLHLHVHLHQNINKQVNLHLNIVKYSLNNDSSHVALQPRPSRSFTRLLIADELCLCGCICLQDMAETLMLCISFVSSWLNVINICRHFAIFANQILIIESLPARFKAILMVLPQS